ncbi:hypothetical protein QJS10_CPA08g00947 [Acorus calamus]|uniref:Uncharacterized protein n=1 Tax=Acorus calamus TaxID=4465 RepID=A0AAV9EB06_ACOCL|nr:hypothetical protein QJS10_CPA08g00947 [Acorus calamus]
MDIRLSENPIVDPEKGGIPRFVQVARLAKVQILNGSEDIRLSENPIVDPEKGGIPRFVQVACLAKVQILNGSEVGKLKVLCERFSS